ncbi:hypothetical protein MASR1M90_19820 [Desulfovibrionales bacterium]
MNIRTFSVLILLLAILSAALWYRTLVQPPHLLTADSLHGFIPEHVDLSSIDSLEFSRPNTAPVRLQKVHGRWELPNLGGVQAHARHVQELLAALADLRGEVRAEGSDIWEQFGLTSDQAVHVSLRTHGTEQLGLFFGRSDIRTVFMRMSGSQTIYAAPATILAQLGAYGAAWSDQFWLETTLAAFHPDSIRSVRLKTPQAEAMLVRDIPEATNTSPWAVHHIAGEKLSQESLEAVLPALSRVTVFAALTPDDPLRTLLDTPQYRMDIVTEAGNITLEGSPHPDGALVRRSDQSFIYRMYPPVFERLFTAQHTKEK